MAEQNSYFETNGEREDTTGTDFAIAAGKMIVSNLGSGGSILGMAASNLGDSYENLRDGKYTQATLSAIGISGVTEPQQNEAQSTSIWGKVLNIFKSVIMLPLKLLGSFIPFGSFGFSLLSSGINQTYSYAQGQLTRSDIKDMFFLKTDEDVKKFYNALDTNKDGIVDGVELKTAQDILDKNKDGTITPDEINAHGGANGALAYIQSQHKDRIDESTYSEYKGKSELLAHLGQSAKRVVNQNWDRLDTNKDGRVEWSEYRKAVRAFDKDNNGIITDNEMAPYRKNPELAFKVINDRKQRG